MKLLVIGAGNMGESIIRGVLKKRLLTPENIAIYEVKEELSKKLEKKLKINILPKIDDKITDYDIVLLAVKPQVFVSFKTDSNMANLSKFIKGNQSVVSIMAGITITKLKEFFINTKNISRIMPNTAALVSEAMSAITFSDDFDEDKKDFIVKLFGSIGETQIIEEKYFNVVTALSGSGPAFFFIFIEALTQGGLLCGLPKDIAEKLAIQTAYGASALAKNKKVNIEELRHMVTSPGGTTIAGVTELEKNSFRYSIINAVKAAYNRAEELGKL